MGPICLREVGRAMTEVSFGGKSAANHLVDAIGKASEGDAGGATVEAAQGLVKGVWKIIKIVLGNN
jgi:hypothetical protein